MALLGPSGSGKTTLLRILGGLEFADSGSVRFADLNWLDMPARTRNAGFVFQHYALFRHMTVAENIAFGLEGAAAPQAAVRAARSPARVEELLALVQLDGLEDRYPSQLSGGQRQRVALARALAIEPRMLLLDEPFGALDAKVRKELRADLRRIHDHAGITTVFVTHDQEEAFAVADLVAVMKDGRIEQYGAARRCAAQSADGIRVGVSVRLACDGFGDRLAHPYAIDRRRKNAAGEARAFARRIKPARIQALIVVAAPDADGRRGARLHPGQHGVGPVEALDLAAEGGQRLAYRLRWRKSGRQAARSVGVTPGR